MPERGAAPKDPADLRIGIVRMRYIRPGNTGYRDKAGLTSTSEIGVRWLLQLPEGITTPDSDQQELGVPRSSRRDQLAAARRRSAEPGSSGLADGRPVSHP
jgi:hypothetical protein